MIVWTRGRQPGQALALSLMVATGRMRLVAAATPSPVLYVALRGSAAGLRARISAGARVIGLDPDSDDLDGLHIIHKPDPFDLSDTRTVEWLREEAESVGAGLIVVDTSITCRWSP